MDPRSSRGGMMNRLNRTLTRATGFELRRATSPMPPSTGEDSLRRQGAPGPRRTPQGSGPGNSQATRGAQADGGARGKDHGRRGTGQGAQGSGKGKGKTKGKGKSRAGAGKLEASKHYDDEANALIARVAPRTMTSPEKLYPLIQAVRHIVAAEVEGDFVECGVWRGGSMQAVAWTLLAQGVEDRELHLFDTFEGMPPPGEEDRRTRDGAPASLLLEQHDLDHRVWAYASLEDVREGMTDTGYPGERIHYVPGLVEDTVPAEAPDRIALLRLDTDWYASTKHLLEQLYPRLVPGGVLLLDDYGAWEGARKATEEYLESIDDHLLLLPMAEGRIALKPVQ